MIQESWIDIDLLHIYVLPKNRCVVAIKYKYRDSFWLILSIVKLKLNRVAQLVKDPYCAHANSLVTCQNFGLLVREEFGEKQLCDRFRTRGVGPVQYASCDVRVSVCLSVRDIAEDPLPGVLDNCGQRAYR